MRGLMRGVVLGAWVVAGSAWAEGCWTPQEKSLWASDELDNVLTFSFRSALDCKPVAYAQVSFGAVTLATDAQGLLRVPAPTGLDDALVPLEVRAEGFMRYRDNLHFAFNTPRTNRFLLSPKLAPDNVRFVLSWNDAPRDLDLHLVGPGYHVSYQNMKSVAHEARLDRDAQQGWGPETITALRLRRDAGYEVWVHNYSGDGAFDGKPRVAVYSNGDLARLIEIPAASKRWLRVARIANGEIDYELVPADHGPRR